MDFCPGWTRRDHLGISRFGKSPLCFSFEGFGIENKYADRSPLILIF
jgi:hypothetical protein